MSIKIWSTNQSYRPWRLDVIVVDVRYQFQFWNRSTSLWLTVAYLFKLLFHVVRNSSVTDVRLSDEGISALKTSPIAKAYALLCISAFLSLFSFFSPVSLSFVSVLLLSVPPSSPRAYFQALKRSSSHYSVMRPPVVKRVTIWGWINTEFTRNVFTSEFAGVKRELHWVPTDTNALSRWIDADMVYIVFVFIRPKSWNNLSNLKANVL